MSFPEGEFGLISRIRERVGPERPPWLTRSIGDDCAVLDPSRWRHCVMTTDMLVEGVHFRLDWVHPRLVGRKACLVNVSDIAAMGAQPRGCLLGLALAKRSVDCFDPLVEGFIEEAERQGMALVGGDLSAADRALISVTAWGSIEEGEPVFRNGARPGDHILVVGELAKSQAGLQLLRRSEGRWKGAESLEAIQEDTDPGAFEALRAHLLPEIQVEAGRWFQAAGKASAMIDVSDGLASDLMHILEESGVSGELEADRISRPASASEGEQSWEGALDGGEDYALLLTVPDREMDQLSEQYPPGLTPYREIGRIVERSEKSQLFVTRKGQRYSYRARGFDHFL